MTLDRIPGTQVFTQRDVRRTPASSQTQSQTIVAPIGAVMAWLKSYTNTPQTLPSGFVECNGQVLSDNESVYDGQTLPDLNGNNNFLRGNSTSGGTGGASTNDLSHTHDVSGTTGTTSHNHGLNTGQIGDLGGSDFFVLNSTSTNAESAHAHSFSDTSDSKLSATQENKPPYYDIVWIMRIK